MKTEQELIILGLLKDKPRHGYEIKKQIRDVVSTFAALEVESIYYTLTLLEKKGFIRKAAAQGEAGRPEKFIYNLTPEGDQRFRRLLTKSLLTVERPNFSIDLALYFLPFLPAEVALRRLRGRARILSKVERGLKQLSGHLKAASSYHLSSIVEHNLKLLQAEKNFIKHLGEDFSRNKISLPRWP